MWLHVACLLGFLLRGLLALFGPLGAFWVPLASVWGWCLGVSWSLGRCLAGFSGSPCLGSPLVPLHGAAFFPQGLRPAPARAASLAFRVLPLFSSSPGFFWLLLWVSNEWAWVSNEWGGAIGAPPGWWMKGYWLLLGLANE